MTATKVLIVDDHPAIREGLAVRISAQADLRGLRAGRRYGRGDEAD